MTTPSPATIAGEIQSRLEPYQVAGGAFLVGDNFDFRSIYQEIRKLIKVDAQMGYLFEAQYFQLLGDVEQARAALAKALKLGYGLTYTQVATACLINLGFFSEAQEFFKVAGDPKNGSFLSRFHSGLTCGAFNRTFAFLEQAKLMKLDLTMFPADKVIRIKRVLDAAELSDEEIGRVLDVAGEVMRERRTFYLNPAPDVDVADEPWNSSPCVYVTFRLSLPHEEVAAMYADLSERLCSKFSQISDAFHVSFRAN